MNPTFRPEDLPPDVLLPPAELVMEHSGGISPDQFVLMGNEISRHSLVAHAGLRPDGRILDVGCGCGKIARPLTRHLQPPGEYHGIDITEAAIGWCREAYRGFPNFHFHLADLGSSRYNVGGRVSAANYRFPFGDGQFDLVFLGSVFTHLLPAEVDNYVHEIARVLRPGGKCLATYFVLDDEALAHVKAGRTTPGFRHVYGDQGCRVERTDIPEAAIAYDEGHLRRLYERAGLRIDALNFGQWGRGQLVPHWQDEVWSSRPAES